MKTRIFVLMTLAMMMLPGESSAYDQKLFNGGLCQTKSSGAVQTDGWIYNSSTETSFAVECPIVRDLGASSALTVYAIDRNYNQDMSCYGASLTTGAGASPWWGWWTPTIWSSGANANMQALSLGTISGNTTSFLYIRCTIPTLYSGNRSGVFGYMVREN